MEPSWASPGGPFTAWHDDCASRGMETLNRYLIAHRGIVRIVWLGLLLVLAACQNNGDGGGGDGGGYP